MVTVKVISITLLMGLPGTGSNAAGRHQPFTSREGRLTAQPESHIIAPLQRVATRR
jgi:hypothetical protein